MSSKKEKQVAKYVNVSIGLAVTNAGLCYWADNYQLIAFSALLVGFGLGVGIGSEVQKQRDD